MTSNSPDVLERLTLALDGLCRSLETGRPDAVLAAEEPLADATAAFRAADLAQLARRPDIRMAMTQIRLAMDRCRTLGATAAGLAELLTPGGYGPRGEQRRAGQPSAGTGRGI